MRTLFISLDTVSARRVSCIGPSEVQTPNLDRIAAEGALFTHAFATDIPTQPSHTSIFTGRYGIETGIVSHFHPPAMLGEGEQWLPSEMQQLGCRTAAVDHLFAMKEWFIRGYDDYMAPPGRSRSPASVVNQLAFDWLEDHYRDDFMLFLHYWDAHIPYVPPEPFLSRYTDESAKRVDPMTLEKLQSRPSYPLFKRNLYDHLGPITSLDYIRDLHLAEIAYLDFEIGKLFDRLASLGILDDTLVVIFGDHGENMTEHDAWFDHAGLYDSVVHVPLIIRAPKTVAPRRVDDLVSLIDVMPTVLDLQGMAPAQAKGARSLVPAMSCRDQHPRSEVFLSESTWQAKRGVRNAHWKYIRCYDPGIYRRSGVELYDLGSDPDEQNNVAEQYPEVVGSLGERLDEWLVQYLDGRPDPMVKVISDGLPAVDRLEGVIEEDRRIDEDRRNASYISELGDTRTRV